MKRLAPINQVQKIHGEFQERGLWLRVEFFAHRDPSWKIGITALGNGCSKQTFVFLLRVITQHRVVLAYYTEV